MEILVFKTNVSSKKKVSQIANRLSSVPAIKQWHFDLNDCDKVLRIVTTGLNARFIESLLKIGGFKCEELND